MVIAYSPHRDSGGTLHVPSSADSPGSDPNSRLAELRRSLSRSPSRGPAFRLITSRSNSSSPKSPLSPSPLSPSRRVGIVAVDSTANLHDPSPLATPYSLGSKKKRPILRHLSPMRLSTRSVGLQRSPAKRALTDSSDNGNATPLSSMSTSEGLENEQQSLGEEMEKREGYVPTTALSATENGTHFGPHHALGRRDKPNGYFEVAKSSPLKRSEGSTNLDAVCLGTPAKRRSLHGASFGPDFNIFDQHATINPQESHGSASEIEADSPIWKESSLSSTPLPQRTSSLRKTTLQQRFEKPFSKLGNPENLFDARSPVSPEVKARNRLSLEFPIPQVARESPFAFDNTSIAVSHLTPFARKEVAGQGGLPHAGRHPLARTISQSSSNSSLATDSPTHIPPRQPEQRRPRVDFSRSLPLGALRPTAYGGQSKDSSSEQSSFATPDNYKLTKPLPAAFMSTGLISKRNKNIDPEGFSLADSTSNMPDTPCKRPTSLTSMTPQVTPDINLVKARHARHTMHSFGAPSTPFNPNVSKTTSGSAKGLSIFGSSFDNSVTPLNETNTDLKNKNGSESPFASSQNLAVQTTRTPSTPAKAANTFPRSTRFLPIEGDTKAIWARDFHIDIDMSPPVDHSKSDSIYTPNAVRGTRLDCVPESPPSDATRFRNPLTISSFSRRYQVAGTSGPVKALSRPSPSLPILSKRNKNAKQDFSHPAGPSYTHRERSSPRTPLESMVPPDPSGLSISAKAEKAHGVRKEPSSLHSSFGTPATPTAPKNSLRRSTDFSSSSRPMQRSLSSDIDLSLISRFNKVEHVNSGEFSQVYRVSCKGEFSDLRKCPATSTSSPRSSEDKPAEHVWAVKKANKAFLGPRDRLRKLQEVNILKAIGRADHVIKYEDSWEYEERLYIQTEFCEEGALDSFLEKAGQTARLDDFRIWKIMLELASGLKNIHDSGFIHLDLKPANVLITFEGALKIADFGMATSWPASAGIEGEGDRGYIGPEILKGQFDKPADIFAFGLIMLEIAANVRLPDNGASWQRLRSGDMSDVPSLTSSSDITDVSRDALGDPRANSHSFEGSNILSQHSQAFTGFDFGFDQKSSVASNLAPARNLKVGEVGAPPAFMLDSDHSSALDKIVRWMISPEPQDRPTADQILVTEGVRWVEVRRRSGATIFEGTLGPADDLLHNDVEMIDV